VTIECRAVFVGGGKIRNVDAEKMALFRARHREGDQVTITFDDDVLSESGKQSRLFHALMGKYAEAQGYAKPWAKIELKYLYGVWAAYDDEFRPPKWTRAMFVELPEGYEAAIVYMKSTTCYTKSEWSALIDGTIQACTDCGADIAEILQGAE